MPIAERLIGLIAPHTCILCGQEGSLLCAWCTPDAVPFLPPRCFKCNQASQDSAVCESCRRGSKLRYVWVRAEYNGVAKALIYRFKFGRTRSAAQPIAHLMEETIPWLAPDTLIAHVPTASSRRRGRGYDHAELLAKELARARKLHHFSLLGRIGQTRQVGAKRQQRLDQLNQAFYAKYTLMIKGANILLVDDITTTGGTLEAAAKVLKIAGARTVNAAVFAQKL